MTYQFNDEQVTKNILELLGEENKEFLPHGVTINEYLGKLEPVQLHEIQQSLVYELIRKKIFDEARFQKHWLVIVDATQTYSGIRRINEKYLEIHYKKGTEEETVNYHCDVLEAKIYLGEKLIVGIGSEFIENNGGGYRTPKENECRRAETGLWCGLARSYNLTGGNPVW